jgi:phosphoribosylamine--glycine ligase
MNVLLLGSGGREHALAWKLAQSPRLTKLWAAPGNPGIAQHAECVALDHDHLESVLAFARGQEIGLVVVGPEQPLVDGLADLLRENGVLTFGPSAAAARLEGSKGFTKDLCARHDIPTARYRRFDDREAAREGLEDFGLPVVIKADGLASGKGVVIAWTGPEAEDAVDHVFSAYGGGGTQIVIEEFLHGEEASFFVLQPGGDLHPGNPAAGDGRDRRSDAGGDGRGRRALFGRALCRPDADRRGAQADRI